MEHTADATLATQPLNMNKSVPNEGLPNIHEAYSRVERV